MDKTDLTEELTNLIKYIGKLEIKLTDYKNNKSIYDPEGRKEYVDMELQLSAMSLYKLYLERRTNRS